MSDADETVKVEQDVDENSASASSKSGKTDKKVKLKKKTAVPITMAATLGSLSPFDPQKENFKDWMIVFNAVLFSNGLDPEKDTDKKCKSLFLASIGTCNVSLVKNLITPITIEAATLQDMSSKLDEHFQPTPKALAERFRFMKRSQSQDETIAQYMAELRKLASNCKFDSKSLSERLRDQLILGLKSQTAQNTILTKDDDIKLDEVIKIATSQEMADLSTALFRGNPASSQDGGEINFSVTLTEG